MIIRQSTARTILVGPVLDSTGAAKTDEVVGSIKVTKNGTVGAADGSATLTHDHAGKYKLALTANDCDTVGVLEISLNSGTNDMPVKACNVIETAIWDALFADGATGLLPANMTQIGGDTQSATDLKDFADAGYDPTTNAVTAALDPAVGAQITAIETFATRMTTGLVQDGLVYQFTANMLEMGPSSSGGDATLAKQVEILTAIQGSTVIQVASPNVSGNLVLTQGDDYDGTANPKASWTVSTDYTDGWSVTLTIRDADDEVVYTTAGEVVSSTVVAVTIAAPTGLTMTGCPGQWQGKFDVELTKATKKKTIALGVCYINEDQTR